MGTTNKHYTEVNSAIIDGWVEGGWEWGVPIDHESYERAKAGQCKVLLSPTRYVPEKWFSKLSGAKVLGLASGGGQQMPVFAANGADCTVLDYSLRQLESEELVSRREGYDITIVHADMTKRLPFEDESFDLIFHPISNVYVQDVRAVWRECFRVLKPGGRLLAGLCNSLNYAFNEEETELENKLPFNPLNDEALYLRCIRKNCGIQFSHSIEEQIGGQLEAGFILRDIYQDTNGTGRLHEYGVPTFYCTYSEKPAK